MDPFNPLNPRSPSIQDMEKETLRRIQNLPQTLFPSQSQVQEEEEETEEEEEEEH